MDKEMLTALIADGEKLAAMTGEDHGPYFVDYQDEQDPAGRIAATIETAPTVAAQQCGLDPKAHEAAAAEYARHHRDGKPHGFCLDSAITAYLSHAAGDVDGLDESLTEPLSMSMFVSQNDMIARLLSDRNRAATTIRALSASTEAAEARVKEMEAERDQLLGNAPVIDGSPIAEFVANYQFDASDEGIVHTPSFHEQAMIEDAICSFIADGERLRAARSLSIKEAGSNG